MTDTAFRYEQSLQGREIRLIQLTSAGYGADISCSLVYKTLDSDTAYNALSYVWGDQSEKRRVICNGMACMVTVNLFHALAHIRSTRADVFLWADALCIDQNNEAEKTRQVRMMGDIYRQAQLVVFWLGLEEEHDRESYSIACRVYDLLGDVTLGLAESVAEGGKTLDLEKAGLPGEPSDSRWAHLVHLLTKEWYSRIWIVQEFLVASSCIFSCGQLEMDPKVLLSVCTHLSVQYQLRTALSVADSVANLVANSVAKSVTNFVDPSIPTAGISFGGASLRYLLQKRKEESGLDLFVLLVITKFFISTDPRDRIFALIGLQNNIPLDCINYSHELSSVELQVTLAVLAYVEFPTALLACTTSLGSRSGLPSWVVAWGNRPRAVREFTELVLPLDNCDCGDPDFWVEDQKKLHVRGKIVDRVRHIFWDTPYERTRVGEITDWVVHTLIPSFNAWITDVIRLCNQMHGASTESCSKEELWRALVCDGAPYHIHAPPHYEDAFKAWVEWLRDFLSVYNGAKRFLEKAEISGLDDDEEIHIEQLVSQLEHLEQCRQTFLPYEGNMNMFVGGRRLCFTENNHIAWVSRDVREGDEVAFIYGSRVPFILRSPDADHDLDNNATEDPLNPKRLMVGDCYVQGLMHGEPIKMQNIPECMIALV